MRPSFILRAYNGGPAREVAFTDARVAALIETNDRLFADEAALLFYLQGSRSVFMDLFEYRLRPEDTLRPAA